MIHLVVAAHVDDHASRDEEKSTNDVYRFDGKKNIRKFKIGDTSQL